MTAQGHEDELSPPSWAAVAGFESGPLLSMIRAMQAFGSGSKNDLAAHRAVADLPQSLGAALQRIARHHIGRELLRRVESEQLAKASADLFRPLILVVADLQAADLDILEQQVIRLDRRDLPPASRSRPFGRAKRGPAMRHGTRSA